MKSNIVCLKKSFICQSTYNSMSYNCYRIVDHKRCHSDMEILNIFLKCSCMSHQTSDEMKKKKKTKPVTFAYFYLADF